MLTKYKIFDVHIAPSRSSKSCCIPGQAMNIQEILDRFSNGQRLNVNQRPQNMVGDDVPDETFDNVQPQIDEVSDLIDYQEEQELRKQELKRKRAKRSEAKERESEEPVKEEE